MKKAFPYIIGAVLLLLLVIIMTSNTSKPQRKLDERITLRQKDKVPYGTRVAQELLSSLYPGAACPMDQDFPGAWDSIDITKSNQAVILIADYFEADEDELAELSDFVERGNYVYIISRTASDDVSTFFHLSYGSGYYNPYGSSDSMSIRLNDSVFKNDSVYTYPGKKYEGSFYAVDTTYTAVLGRNGIGLANFIQLNKGEGSFFLHTSPLAFSNYFILHKNNLGYYQKALSVFPQDVSSILWNEYFLEKPRNRQKDDEPNWLGTLFSYPSFKWGFLIAACTLALFVLLGMRRKQRMIPVLEKPKNDSLDFVKTLGRLYYDRSDHQNLANKMAAYFLEHIRSHYKMPTHTLDETFINSLHFKSGYPSEEIGRIINTMHTIRMSQTVTEWQLSDFHKQLELFYQNT